MTTEKEQLDLFVALIGDVPFRDDREAMSAPLVSLSKKPPNRLDWTGPSGQKVTIVGSEGGQIATIYDFDIIIWAISQINAQIERGNPNPGATITFRSYDLLQAIHRDVGGRQYLLLKDAIRRLTGTKIETTIRRREKDRTEIFNLLNDASWDEDTEGRPKGMQITIPRWIYKAILNRTDVLAISPLYFDLTGGLDRFLYRLARRHAGNGKDNPNGWAFSFRDLHSRTGSPAPYGEFARDLRKAIKRDGLPTYTLVEEEGVSGPLLRMCWRRV